jgi:hypothetical protein
LSLGLVLLGLLLVQFLGTTSTRKLPPLEGKREGDGFGFRKERALDATITLGVPIGLEGKERAGRQGILALKLWAEGGGPAAREPVRFLHGESLRLGEGFTDKQGEFRVFEEGTYVFRVGGRKLIRKQLPPVQISASERKSSREAGKAPARPSFLRLKLALGGSLKVFLKTYPKEDPFLDSHGLLFLASASKRKPSVDWRRAGFFSTESFFSFLQGELKARRGEGRTERKGAAKSLLEKGVYEKLLLRYQKRTGVEEEAWVPYVDPSFLETAPQKDGVLLWRGLPDLPLRWGLLDADLSLKQDPPFEEVGIVMKKGEGEKGSPRFSFKGRQPKDLSGRIRLSPGEVRRCYPKIYGGNGVVVSVPVSEGWSFQVKPLLFDIDQKGDIYKGGAMIVRTPERKGLRLKNGRYSFENLEAGKKKNVYCVLRNAKGTTFLVLKSREFLFEGDWLDLGSLTPLEGEDSVLKVRVEGDPMEAEALFPLTVRAKISGYPFGKIKVWKDRPLTFLGARGKSFFLVDPLDEELFPATCGMKYRDWKFVRAQENEIKPDMGSITKMGPVQWIHLAPLRLKKISIFARVVDTGGVDFKNRRLGLSVLCYPQALGGEIRNRIEKEGGDSQVFQGEISVDAGIPLQVLIGKFSVHLGGHSGGNFDWDQWRFFSGFTTKISSSATLSLKPLYRVEVLGLKRDAGTRTKYRLKSKELFGKKIPYFAGSPESSLIPKGKRMVTELPIPLPNTYVLLKVRSGSKPKVLTTVRILPSNPRVVVR